jgi:hypothetical protein
VIGEEPLEVAVGSTPAFSVSATGEEELTYSWHSSVGDLEFYRSETMELVAEVAAEGVIIIVVRDTLGGTEWRILPIAVR